MLVNLAFVKSENGLFYFALDYIAAIKPLISRVLVRSTAMETTVRKRYPDLIVVRAGPVSALLTGFRAAAAGEMVFTPSSHPIPWCSGQLVVLHDTFPFRGSVGALKNFLFQLSLATSAAKVGFVNRSVARAFLVDAKIDPERLISTPNRLDKPGVLPRPASPTASPPVVGLVGTDSPKKNYDLLFAAISSVPGRCALQFSVFGQANAYMAGLQSRFPALNVSIVDSSEVPLETFVQSVDVIASAATAEGFSRPVALALMLGTPVWLVDAPVFREFYDGAGTFFSDAEALGGALAKLAPGTVLARPSFEAPCWIEREFQACVRMMITGESATR